MVEGSGFEKPSASPSIDETAENKPIRNTDSAEDSPNGPPFGPPQSASSDDDLKAVVAQAAAAG